MVNGIGIKAPGVGFVSWLKRGRTAFVMLAAGLTLAACGGNFGVDYDGPLDSAVSQGWNVSQIDVSVPDELTVSDKNVFVPRADIVWHGDPPGDRRAQVHDIVATAATRATAGLKGAEPVALSLTVTQFHGVTPKAMLQAPSAVHNIKMMARITDARSGAILVGPTEISADLPAQVGTLPYYAGEGGSTQKKRVTDHVEAVLKGWLGIGPDIRGTFSSAGR